MSSSGSYAAVVDVLLSLLRLAIGPQLVSVLLVVDEEVDRPSLLKARLPCDILRCIRFVGLDEAGDECGSIADEGEIRGSGSLSKSRFHSEVCGCDVWNDRGEPLCDDQLGLGAIEEVLCAEAGVIVKPNEPWGKDVLTRWIEGILCNGRTEGAGGELAGLSSATSIALSALAAIVPACCGLLVGFLRLCYRWSLLFRKP